MSSWFLRRRMEFIVERVRRHGIVHGEEVAGYFGISPATASIDLRSIRTEYPDLLTRSGRPSGGFIAGPLFDEYVAKGILEPLLDYSKSHRAEPTEYELRENENTTEYWKSRALKAEEFLAVRTEEMRKLHPALHALMRATEDPALVYWRNSQ